MKIKSKVVALLASCMILGACASTSTNGVLAQIGDNQPITANEVYGDLLNSSTGRSQAFQFLCQEIISSKNPVTDAMTTEADLAIENIQNSYTSYYGSNAEQYLQQALQQSGFASLDEYRSTMIYSFQMQEFLKAYVDSHFDELFEDYYSLKNPRYVSHILIKMDDPDNPTEEQKNKLDKVQELLNQGGDFAEIAKEYSEDTSAPNGGALGICDADTNFVEAFKTVALALEPGVVSEPVKSDYGYHFILVTSNDKETMKNDTQVKEDLLLSYDADLLYVALNQYELTFNNETLKKVYEDGIKTALERREASRKAGAE